MTNRIRRKYEVKDIGKDLSGIDLINGNVDLAKAVIKGEDYGKQSVLKGTAGQDVFQIDLEAADGNMIVIDDYDPTQDKIVILGSDDPNMIGYSADPEGWAKKRADATGSDKWDRVRYAYNSGKTNRSVNVSGKGAVLEVRLEEGVSAEDITLLQYGDCPGTSKPTETNDEFVPLQPSGDGTTGGNPVPDEQASPTMKDTISSPTEDGNPDSDGNPAPKSSGDHNIISNNERAAVEHNEDCLMELNMTTEYHSPLVLDLDGNGVTTVAKKGNEVMFDINENTPDKEHVGWVGEGDALLVYDLNGDGSIEGKSELFGDDRERGWANGFDKLAALDVNQDKIIDSEDIFEGVPVLDLLQLWEDANLNGTSEKGELTTASAAGVMAIDLNYEDLHANGATKYDNGNQIRQTARFQKMNKDQAGNPVNVVTNEIADVWFLVG